MLPRSTTAVPAARHTPDGAQRMFLGLAARGWVRLGVIFFAVAAWVGLFAAVGAL